MMRVRVVEVEGTPEELASSGGLSELLRGGPAEDVAGATEATKHEGSEGTSQPPRLGHRICRKDDDVGRTTNSVPKDPPVVGVRHGGGSPVVGHVIELEPTVLLVGHPDCRRVGLPAQRATANVSNPSHRGSLDMVDGRHADQDRPATNRSATVV